MKCEICGHRPHPGFHCNIPVDSSPDGASYSLCECPFDSREPVVQSTMFDIDIPLPAPDENRPGLVRIDARDTSRAAAALVEPRTGSWRSKVLLAVAEYPRTDDGLISALHGSPNTIRPRRVELMEDGWIEDSGERRATITGAQAAVWRLTEQGRKQLGAS